MSSFARVLQMKKLSRARREVIRTVSCSRLPEVQAGCPLSPSKNQKISREKTPPETPPIWCLEFHHLRFISRAGAVLG